MVWLDTVYFCKIGMRVFLNIGTQMYLRLTDDRVVYDGVVSEVEVDGLDLADLGAQGELLDNLDLDRYRVLQKNKTETK